MISSIWQKTILTETLGVQYPELVVFRGRMPGGFITCPAEGTCFPKGQLWLTITHLNDDHRWDRNDIADWVEKFLAEQG